MSFNVDKRHFAHFQYLGNFLCYGQVFLRPLVYFLNSPISLSFAHNPQCEIHISLPVLLDENPKRLIRDKRFASA